MEIEGGPLIIGNPMPKLTRVEVIDSDGHLAGLFFTSLSVVRECEQRTLADFAIVEGEWEPAGGTENGTTPWHSSGVRLGTIIEVTT